MDDVDNMDSRPYDLSEKWTEVTDLQFLGKRFEDHSVELSVAEELVQFQELVTELAEELYRRTNKKKLPPGFVALTKLRFNAVESGSAVLPIQAPVLTAETFFGEEPSPYVAQAVQILYDAIRSQERGDPLPDAFPRGKMVSQLSKWGSTLQPDEAIGVGEAIKQNGKRKRARFSRATKSRLFDYVQDTYSEVVNLFGEVRSIDFDTFQSHIRLPNQKRVDVRFDASLVGEFRKVLDGGPVSVTGVAKISRIDGYVQQLSSVTEINPVRETTSDSIDDFLANVASKADWSKVPRDLSKRIDYYLYGEEPT